MFPSLPFRLGATSYVIPAGLVENVTYLAEKVDDVELILFDLPGGPSNLPSAAEQKELARLAQQFNLSYTVHLPLDLRLGENGELDHPSLIQARKVIECTQSLNPWAYIAHLDGRRTFFPPYSLPPSLWAAQAQAALQQVTHWIGSAACLAVENLEQYPPNYMDLPLQNLSLSRCVDIGHLWLDQLDPCPHLQSALPRTRVMHLHGVQRQANSPAADHQALTHQSDESILPVLSALLEVRYSGVLTLEMYAADQLNRSLQVLQRLLKQIPEVV